MAVRGDDVEDDAPALAVGVGGPVVVGDDGFAVFGPTAGGDEGGAIAGRGEVRCGGALLLLIRLRNIVIGDLFHGVKGDDIPDVELVALRGGAVGDALELLLVFRVGFRPEHRTRGFAVEGPVAFGAMRVVEADGVQSIFDLFRKQGSVLKADIVGRAFEVNVDPAVAFEAIGFCGAGGLRGSQDEAWRRTGKGVERCFACEFLSGSTAAR